MSICSAVAAVGIKAAFDQYMTTDKKVEEIKITLNKADKDLQELDNKTAQSIKDLDHKFEMGMQALGDKIETMKTSQETMEKSLETMASDVGRLVKAMDGTSPKMKPSWMFW